MEQLAHAQARLVPVVVFAQGDDVRIVIPVAELVGECPDERAGAPGMQRHRVRGSGRLRPRSVEGSLDERLNIGKVQVGELLAFHGRLRRVYTARLDSVDQDVSAAKSQAEPPREGRLRGIGHHRIGLTARPSDDKAIIVPRPVNDISQARAAWQAQIVPDPTLPDRSVALCEALRRVHRMLLRGPRRLARAERAAVLAATKATLAGPRDFTGAGYDERMERCMARANIDVAVCELIALLGAPCAELAFELAAILAGTRVAPCTPACCNAGSVALAQRNARDAAVRALTAVGPTGLARLSAGALLP